MVEIMGKREAKHNRQDSLLKAMCTSHSTKSMVLEKGNWGAGVVHGKVEVKV